MALSLYIGAVAWINPDSILMRAAADTLLEIAADPKHLGAKIGFLSVLHTWGQNLNWRLMRILSS